MCDFEMNVDAARDVSRRGKSVYLLCRRCENGEILPTGTAFAIQCQSSTLLLTTIRSVVDPDTNETMSDLFVVKGLEATTGVVNLASDPINVAVVQMSDTKIDVAVLKAELPFESFLSLCPVADLPVIENEYKVKIYHCPMNAYLQGTVPFVGIASTEFQKVCLQSGHHLFLKDDSIQGSSGCPVIDSFGRLIGMVQTGMHLGQEEETISKKPDTEEQVLLTLWERMTHINYYSRSLAKAIILSTVPSLSEYLASH